MINNYSGNYTDFYQISMAQAYFLQGNKDTVATFDYFFRKIPDGGGYVLFAGLKDVLDTLVNLRYDSDDMAFLKEQNLDPGFIEYLKKFRFQADVFSVQEGDVVFPTMPVLRVVGNIIEAQIVETMLLNILNYQSLVATKASRIRLAAGERSILSDFGLRRAHSFGGIHASRASVIGGFNSTSNVYSAQQYGIKPEGTMAHSFVQCQKDELTAFRKFVEAHPERGVLLVDTYDTLKSGVPNAIKVAKEMEDRNQQLLGVRLDSGDLAYLAKRARKMLDENDLQYVKIVASNQLNEYVIKSLKEQGAPVDVFGVGTELVTGRPDAALDGVYKLSMAGNEPRLKISENMKKVTLPGNKQVFRVLNGDGLFYGADVVAIEDEKDVAVMHHPFEKGKFLNIAGCEKFPLLNKVMQKGEISIDEKSTTEIAKYANSQLNKLPQEYKRFENPHIYKIGLSDKLNELRNNLWDQYRK